MRRLSPAYEADAAAAWVRLLADGATVWDVGANVGLYTLLSAALVGPTGRVVAWEPSPATFDILKDHVCANKLIDRVRLVQGAIADRRDTTVPFGTSGTDPTNRISTRIGNVIKVPVETLDGYSTDTGSRPDVIKIDIEGAEVLALRGAADLLSSTRPTLMIAVHPMFLPEFGCSPADLEPLLERHEYGCWTLAGVPARPTNYSEYLCLPHERAKAILGQLDSTR
jgi:FkbM family methyltransferase